MKKLYSNRILNDFKYCLPYGCYIFIIIVLRKIKNILIQLPLLKIIYLLVKQLTQWLMEPRGSMQHAQGLSNNPYPESNQPNYLWLTAPRGATPVN